MSACQAADKCIADINKETHMRKISLSFTHQIRDLGAITSHQLNVQQQCKKQRGQLCQKGTKSKTGSTQPSLFWFKIGFPQFLSSHVTEVHQTATCNDQSYFTSLSVHSEQR